MKVKAAPWWPPRYLLLIEPMAIPAIQIVVPCLVEGIHREKGEILDSLPESTEKALVQMGRAKVVQKPKAS